MKLFGFVIHVHIDLKPLTLFFLIVQAPVSLKALMD